MRKNSPVHLLPHSLPNNRYETTHREPSAVPCSVAALKTSHRDAEAPVQIQSSLRQHTVAASTEGCLRLG
ncbi:hypothetical protein JANAI62_13650 [Jannaschia pagri]|uniref:Uncharacterized protein n=1 Tax=Jannaschia pagri TaxID=2829797 RepID=A0ABQ4NK26_9RHOB|nr:hypothetical protein JANAI61_13690 [Jannaschia sp. AI_61]GIT94742.1 hypothetical protein JANAI62_13650 [Jannaschia sp. AI_62]